MIIGLTGGIATGKSTVAKFLEEMNIKVIDSDKIAHEILNYKETINEIEEEFGSTVLNKDGSINRKKLGEIVFDDLDKLKKLESITHHRIFGVIDEKINKNKPDNEIIVLDAPLLFETSLDNKVDETWVIYTDKKTQIKRLKKRDGLDKDDALKRIKAQMPLEEKINKADIIIDNTGTKEELKEKVKRLIEERR
ncbi:MAG: dephospho-CoA kinase [Bacillota bacterium]